jgi:hypothetical protein
MCYRKILNPVFLYFNCEDFLQEEIEGKLNLAMDLGYFKDGSGCFYKNRKL